MAGVMLFCCNTCKYWLWSNLPFRPWNAGIAVIESAADAASSGTSTTAGSGSAGGLSLPTPTVNGVTATELSTPLGTVVQLSQGGVAETVIGSVTGPVALQAAAGLLLAVIVAYLLGRRRGRKRSAIVEIRRV